MQSYRTAQSGAKRRSLVGKLVQLTLTLGDCAAPRHKSTAVQHQNPDGYATLITQGLLSVIDLSSHESCTPIVPSFPVLFHIVIVNTEYSNGSSYGPVPTSIESLTFSGLCGVSVPATTHCCTNPKCILTQWSLCKRHCHDRRLE